MICNTAPLARQPTNYFHLLERKSPPAPKHTFTNLEGTVAFHLTLRPSKLTVHEVVELYQLPDLVPALLDFFSLEKLCQGRANLWKNPRCAGNPIGGDRINSRRGTLYFDEIRVWSNVRIQRKSAQLDHLVLPSQQLQAWHPSRDQKWPFGRYDTCVICNDPHKTFKGYIDIGENGMSSFNSLCKLSDTLILLDHTVVTIRLIFQPISRLPGYPTLYLAYMEKFSVVRFDDAKGMYLLKRTVRKDGSALGDVVLLDQIRTDVEVVPCFGKPDQEISKSLQANNSMHHANQFYLNIYCDEEVFYLFQDLRGVKKNH